LNGLNDVSAVMFCPASERTAITSEMDKRRGPYPDHSEAFYRRFWSIVRTGIDDLVKLRRLKNNHQIDAWP
jgi:hypothetical protein